MNAQHAKQVFKNSLYRSLGETTSALGVDRREPRTLRVLMYHKVNDIPDNPTTVPIGLFDEQMSQLADLGFRVVGLDAVLDHYQGGTALPAGATLITFDDGYRDVLENAAPVLGRHGYPAVLFVPVAFMEGDPALPHERLLRQRGVVNATVGWSELADLEAAGVRIESHGIAHKPLAEIELDEAIREITISKLRLEDRLGREVRSFAYVKGSEAHFRPVHVNLVRQAGYEIAFTSVSGANAPTTDPLRLRRYDIEPYSPRTFELVLLGACDLMAVKDTVNGTRARRLFNQVLGTATQ